MTPNDDQLREEATRAAADLNLDLTRTTVLEIAGRIRKRMAETLQQIRPAGAS